MAARNLLIVGTSILSVGVHWHERLQTRLDAQYPGQFTIVNKAEAGSPSDERLANLTGPVASPPSGANGWLGDFNPSHVIIEAGWNDPYHGIYYEATKTLTQQLIAATVNHGAIPILAILTPVAERYLNTYSGPAIFPDGVSNPVRDNWRDNVYTKTSYLQWQYYLRQWQRQYALQIGIATIDFYEALVDNTVPDPGVGVSRYAISNWMDSPGIHPIAYGAGTVAMADIVNLDIFAPGYVPPIYIPPIVDASPYLSIPYLYTGSGMQVGGYGIEYTAPPPTILRRLKYFDGAEWRVGALKYHNGVDWVEAELKSMLQVLRV